MPRPEQAIVILAASPSDLEPERTQRGEVIRESNLLCAVLSRRQIFPLLVVGGGGRFIT